MFKLRMSAVPLLVLVLLVGCSRSAVNCPAFLRADLPAIETLAADDTLPFQFPLEGLGSYERAYTEFCRFDRYSGEYHAAEDYLRPAGTPVYAMAAGDVTFSGPMGGYGWLQPSAVINDQTIPMDGFSRPRFSFLAIWWIELLFTAIYVIGGTSMLVFAIRKNRPSILAISCGFLLVAGWIFCGKGFRFSYAIFGVAIVCALIGGYHFMHRSTPIPSAQS